MKIDNDSTRKYLKDIDRAIKICKHFNTKKNKTNK